jgi:hypothetical protein
MDPKDIQAAIDAIKNGDAQGALDLLEKILVSAAGGTPAADPAPADTLAADPEPPPAKLAALTALRTLTGCQSLGEAVAVLTAWKGDRDTAATNAAALEESSRTVLVGELVKLNADTPATAWIGEGKDRKPVDRLAKEPIAELRSRVVALRAAGPRTPAAPQPPAAAAPITTADGRVVVLSATELEAAEKIKDPAKKADFIARRAARAKG